jgi:chloride channel protein, CIC family
LKAQPSLNPSERASDEDKVLLVLTLLIGAVAGLVVVAFILVTERLGARLYPAGGAAWRRVLIPVAGSLITGFLLSRYFPNARGSGIPQTKAALFLHDGYISLRTVLGKFGLCSVSLASGIALGREGPSVHVSAGIASVMGRKLGLSPAGVKALLPVGAAAAVAAAFNTPIAAVLFSLEEVVGDMHAPVLGSVVLSSATSWMVLHLILGDEPLFHVPAYQLVHPIEFAIYAFLGLAGGFAGTGFVKLLLWQRKRFMALPRSTQWMQPAVGGLTVGLLGWYFPDVLGVGYGIVGLALNGQLVVGMMGLLVLLKIIATATCYSSGNAGGIFGPSLYIGAMLGGTIGGIAHSLLPDYTGSAGAYALVGMGAAFAAIVRVPLTSVIMIFEITRDYTIIVPLMVANLASYLISSRLQETPIYEALSEQDGLHLPSGARAREQVLTVLNATRTESALKAQTTARDALVAVDREQGAWPVADAGAFHGMVTLQRMESAPEKPLGELLEPGFPHLHPDHSLDSALRRIAASGIPVLPVVSRSNIHELIGVADVPHILAAYRMAHAAGERAAPAATLSRRRLVAGALAVLIAAGILGGFLRTYYRSEQAARAERALRAANELMSRERYDEAIASYREALSITHRTADRLALGLALAKANRPAEALIYLEQVLREEPANGPAHLAIAQIDATAGRIDDAVAHYQRAIYGAWPDRVDESRLAARLEMIQLLEKAGRREQAAGELAALAETRPGDLELQKRIARQFVQLGAQSRAAEMWSDIANRHPEDPETWRELGETRLAMGDFAACRDAFRSAHLDQRAELCASASIMDPTARGLGAAEKRRRSRMLLAAVRKELGDCAISPAVKGEDDAEAAERLWRACKVPSSDSAAAHVMAKLLAQ